VFEIYLFAFHLTEILVSYTIRTTYRLIVIVTFTKITFSPIFELLTITLHQTKISIGYQIFWANFFYWKVTITVFFITFTIM